jgi:hypothetical protein
MVSWGCGKGFRLFVGQSLPLASTSLSQLEITLGLLDYAQPARDCAWLVRDLGQGATGIDLNVLTNRHQGDS